MNPPAKIFRRRPLVAALIGILATGLTPLAARADTLTWNGGAGGSSKWDANFTLFGNYISNWSGHTPPANGDSLIFAGTTTTHTNNTLNHLSVFGLSFATNASAFTLAGNALGLSGDIINQSGSLQTINLPLNLSGHSTWDGGVPGMVVNGKVTLGNHNLTLKNKVEIINAGSDFIVGGNGASMLTLQSASSLSNATAYIGKDVTGKGEVTVRDANSRWNSSGNLYTGSSGRGTLNILNGGQVSNAQGYLGYFGGSQGVARVTGTDSRWSSTLDLKVGVVGSGRLDIEAGGEVWDQSGYLGYSAGGFGHASVTGAGSRWVNSANLTVGLGGDALLNITNGGSVEVGNVLNIGAKGILNLDGGTLSAGAVSLSAGGKFSWISGTLALGSGVVGTAGGLLGNSVTLKAGRTLDIGNAFNIGASGSVSLDGGVLKVGTGNIAAGGQFNWISGTLGLKTASLGSAGSLLGSTVNLNSNQLLELGTLTLGAGSSLKLSNRNTNGTHNLLNSDKTALMFNGGTFHLNDNYVRLASLSGQGAVILGGDAFWSGFPGSLELASDLDSTFAGSISGTGELYKTGAGTVTLSGNSAFNSTYVNQGVLKITNGATVRLGGSGVGFATGAQGTLVVDNAVMDNAYFTYIGFLGSGTLNIVNGGRVNSNGNDGNGKSAYIGRQSTGQGQVTVAGAGSTWAINRDLAVGFNGRGTLDVNSGGVVTIGETLAVGQAGTLNLNGGSLVAKAATKPVGGVFNWSSGTLKLATVTVGDAAGLFGAPLTLGVGQVLETEALTLGSLGELNLAGGQVKVASASKIAGGQFDWSNGTLNITGNGGARLGHDSLLDAFTVIGSGKLLDVTHTLALDADALLVLQGSGRVKVGSMTLTGGMVRANSLNFADIAGITGYGTVVGNVTGGNAANTIHAIGIDTFHNLGTLTLGNANSVSGYDFNGVLRVSNRVILLDKDQADLGVSTHLTRGARIEAGMGLRLGAGETLTFEGDASILGNFENDGSVTGTVSAGRMGTLTFLSDVSGAGSFAGNVLFRAAYNPGNSPAVIDFQGGNATFDANSVLNMEIFGATPGTQYDRLTGINLLTFNGTLNLIFSDGYMPSAGTSFDLFDFASLSGSFNANRINVTGYDRDQLDFSRLASDGTLSVIAAPVPEPETYALFLIGLGLLALRRRWAAR